MKVLSSMKMSYLLLALLVFFFIPGCGATGAPAIPPIETFLIPFETLTGNPTSISISVSEQFPAASGLSTNQSNWSYAAFTVGFWHTVIRVGLAVPVAAFREAFRHTPVEQPDGSWIWSYSITVGGANYTAKLQARFITEGVHWEMRISKEGEYEDFLWYYGEHKLPLTEGFWILKQSPAVPTDLLRIDWSRNISEQTYAIKYTNIVPGGAENGGYIDFRYTKETPYDYTCDIYNKGQDNHTYIEWSSVTGEGRVKDSKHFGDNDWHCWDSNRANVACP